MLSSNKAQIVIGTSISNTQRTGWRLSRNLDITLPLSVCHTQNPAKTVDLFLPCYLYSVPTQSYRTTTWLPNLEVTSTFQTSKPHVLFPMLPSQLSNHGKKSGRTRVTRPWNSTCFVVVASSASKGSFDTRDCFRVLWTSDLGNSWDFHRKERDRLIWDEWPHKRTWKKLQSGLW